MHTRSSRLTPRTAISTASGTVRAIWLILPERSGKMSQVARAVPEALEMAVRGVSREDLICVTGSFYVVGEALKYLSERK